MAVTKAHQRASRKYNEKAYDRIEMTVPKGDKQKIKDHAAAQGESVNGFLNRAVKETMERDGK